MQPLEHPRPPLLAESDTPRTPPAEALALVREVLSQIAKDADQLPEDQREVISHEMNRVHCLAQGIALSLAPMPRRFVQPDMRAEAAS